MAVPPSAGQLIDQWNLLYTLHRRKVDNPAAEYDELDEWGYLIRENERVQYEDSIREYFDLFTAWPRADSPLVRHELTDLYRKVIRFLITGRGAPAATKKRYFAFLALVAEQKNAAWLFSEKKENGYVFLNLSEAFRKLMDLAREPPEENRWVWKGEERKAVVERLIEDVFWPLYEKVYQQNETYQFRDNNTPAIYHYKEATMIILRSEKIGEGGEYFDRLYALYKATDHKGLEVQLIDRDVQFAAATAPINPNSVAAMHVLKSVERRLSELERSPAEQRRMRWRRIVQNEHEFTDPSDAELQRVELAHLLLKDATKIAQSHTDNAEIVSKFESIAAKLGVPRGPLYNRDMREYVEQEAPPPRPTRREQLAELPGKLAERVVSRLEDLQRKRQKTTPATMLSATAFFLAACDDCERRGVLL